MPRFLTLLGLLLPVLLQAQHLVHGRVIDDRSMEPLAFVHIVADGMREGTTTDIDGRFSLNLPAAQARIRLSYVGFAPLEMEVTAGIPVVVRMKRQAVELRTVEIVPGENPAHRIIRNVHASRKENDAIRNRSHRYTSYGKTVFTAALDSALLNDPEQISKLDTSDRETLEWMEKHHLLMVESATRRSFIPPAAEKEEVLALRVSGLDDPSLLGMFASTKTFSIYEPQIVLNEKTYVSPIGPASTERYLFLLEDTLYQGADSVFVISYGPRKGRKFDALKGVLYVNSDGYALQNVIAEPVEREGGISLKLQQQFEKVQGTWFPVQLNTFIYMDMVQLNGWSVLGIGRTYLKDIEVDAPLTRKDVRGPELVVDRMALRKDPGFWAGLRTDSLDERDLRTYHVMDSIGKELKLDKKLRWLGYLATGRVPIGVVNLRLDQLMQFNGYEGFRLGAGLETNDRVSRYFTVGGYFAYGFADQRWKHGGQLSIRPAPRRDLELRFTYANDVAESGGVAFPGPRPLFSSDGSRMWYVDRMDRIERYGAELAFRVNNSLKLWLGTEYAERENVMGYQYLRPLTEGLAFRGSRFVNGGVTAAMRFAFREQVVRLPDRHMVIASRWPVLHLQAFRAVPGLWQGQEDLWRVNAMLEKTFRLRMAGDLSIRALGGMAKHDIPYSFLFNLRGTYDQRAPMAVPNTFETMRPNEFLADRYVSVHVRHSFGNLMIKRKKWRPVPVLVGSAAWGTLASPELHSGYSFQDLGDGFYEAGLQMDNVVPGKITTLGVGAFIRLGEHMLPDMMDNIALKLTLGFGR